jgi:hypothetical protein
MKGLRDQPQFAVGAATERRVAAWLQERGWHVIPSYDYAGPDDDKPPRLQGFKSGYAIPDLDCARGGIRRWVEVKYKSYSPFYRKGGYHTHGISLRLLEHYRTVEVITGTECWLAIYQADTRELLMQSLGELGDPQEGIDQGKPVAYWPRKRFIHLHTFSDDPKESG